MRRLSPAPTLSFGVILRNWDVCSSNALSCKRFLHVVEKREISVPLVRSAAMLFNAKPGIDHRRCSVPCVQFGHGASGAGLPPPLIPSSGEEVPLYSSMGIHP